MQSNKLIGSQSFSQNFFLCQLGNILFPFCTSTNKNKVKRFRYFELDFFFLACSSMQNICNGFSEIVKFYPVGKHKTNFMTI